MVTKDLQFQQLPLIQLKVFTGIVLQGETWSSTHVSSSGGGGYLHNGTGRIAAPTVHSHTTTHQTVWIKEEDSQKDIKLNIPSNVDVMQGHKIKYVELFYNDRYIDYIYIENFNTEKCWVFNTNILAFATKVTATSSHLVRTNIFSFILIWMVLLLASKTGGRYLVEELYSLVTSAAIAIFIFTIIRYINNAKTNKANAKNLTDKIKDVIKKS